MPDAQKCPHCEAKITHEDIEQKKEYDKKQRFDKLFWSQKSIRKLTAVNTISVLLLLFGMFAGVSIVSWLIPATSYPREMNLKIIAGGIAGAVPGIITALTVGNILGKRYNSFKTQHWPTFESGN